MKSRPKQIFHDHSLEVISSDQQSLFASALPTLIFQFQNSVLFTFPNRASIFVYFHMMVKLAIHERPDITLLITLIHK